MRVQTIATIVVALTALSSLAVAAPPADAPHADKNPSAVDQASCCSRLDAEGNRLVCSISEEMRDLLARYRQKLQYEQESEKLWNDLYDISNNDW